jgi:hypothetical protein
LQPPSAPAAGPSPNRGTPSPEVTVSICLVPSPGFSQAPWYSQPVHLCRFPVRFNDLHRLGGFPGSGASATSAALTQHRHHVSACDGRDLPPPSACALEPGLPTPGLHSLLRHPFTPVTKCRNINLLPISYASQPRLRGRLTLRRLPSRRKPWTFGVRVFLPHYRYSCQHSHS